MLGIEYVRPLSKNEIDIFQRAKNGIWEMNVDMLAAKSATKKTYWLNVLMRGRDGVDHLNPFGLPATQVTQFCRAASSLRDEIFPGYTLLASGFSISPAGSEAQRLHIEYYKDIGVIFATLNPLKFTNSVVFYEPQMPEPQLNLYSNGMGYVDDPSEHLPGPVRYKAYIECDPFHIIKLNPNVIHAGAGNSENYDRIMVVVIVSKDASISLDEDEYATDASR